ncbi:hypothetical protein JHK87_044776 [Glycine soja]|nr:hypothetical protein JHK87_044776 [Glycine soja]
MKHKHLCNQIPIVTTLLEQDLFHRFLPLSLSSKETGTYVWKIVHGSDKYVKFDVHIDDDEDNLSEPDQTEFVGTFVNLFHGQGHNINTSFKVGISKVLECLEAEEDDVVLVTLVPKVGKGDVIIGGIKIAFYAIAGNNGGKRIGSRRLPRRWTVTKLPRWWTTALLFTEASLMHHCDAIT